MRQTSVDLQNISDQVATACELAAGALKEAGTADESWGLMVSTAGVLPACANAGPGSAPCTHLIAREF